MLSEHLNNVSTISFIVKNNFIKTQPYTYNILENKIIEYIYIYIRYE